MSANLAPGSSLPVSQGLPASATRQTLFHTIKMGPQSLAVPQASALQLGRKDGEVGGRGEGRRRKGRGRSGWEGETRRERERELSLIHI